MAKKKSQKKNNKARNPDNTNRLPQNIVAIGERVEENKNIYISQQMYKMIHNFTKNKTTNESGGVLIGSVIEEFGKTNIIISGFIEAKYCEGTPTTLKFTHETWEYIHKEIDKKYPDKKIVGWIHTHPNFGIFLSEYDMFIQKNFFNEPYQVAYVIDPIQKIEGFYFWINNNIERCKGFFVYDKTGAKISVGNEQVEEKKPAKNSGSDTLKNIVIVILSILVVYLLFSNYTLTKKFENYANNMAQILSGMQIQINNISAKQNPQTGEADVNSTPGSQAQNPNNIETPMQGENTSQINTEGEKNNE